MARKSNRPAPNSMTSPGLALIIAAWARFGASGPASIRITAHDWRGTAWIEIPR